MSEPASSDPFAGRTVAVLIALGAVLALGFLLMTGFGHEIERDIGARAAPVRSRAGNGFYGLQKLVNAVPRGLASIATDMDDLGPGNGDLLLLTPEPGAKAADIDRLLANRAKPKHPTLIVLPKWQVSQRWFRRNRVQATGLVETDALTKMLPLDDVTIRRTDSGKPRNRADYAGVAFPAVPHLVQSIAGAGLAPLITAPGGGAVLSRVAGHQVYILADPDLIDNRALKSQAGAIAALSLIGALKPDDPGLVSLDTTLNYHTGDRNLIKLMFTPPFLAVTIALIAAALLAGIASAARFGPAVREGRAIALGKTALVDNIAALTRLAGRTRSSGARYADWLRDRTAERLHAPRDLHGEALEAWLDGHAPSGHAAFSELAGRARTAESDSEMLRAAQALDEWRKEASA